MENGISQGMKVGILKVRLQTVTRKSFLINTLITYLYLGIQVVARVSIELNTSLDASSRLRQVQIRVTPSHIATYHSTQLPMFSLTNRPCAYFNSNRHKSSFSFETRKLCISVFPVSCVYTRNINIGTFPPEFYPYNQYPSQCLLIRASSSEQ